MWFFSLSFGSIAVEQAVFSLTATERKLEEMQLWMPGIDLKAERERGGERIGRHHAGRMTKT